MLPSARRSGDGEAADAEAPGSATDASGASPVEQRIVRELQRLFPAGLEVVATEVQVPTFVGEGSSLAIDLEAPASLAEIRDALSKGAGLDLSDEDEPAPTLRDSGGRDDVLVGRVRLEGPGDAASDSGSEPTRGTRLHCWLAADPVRLAASEAVRLARLRLSLD